MTKLSTVFRKSIELLQEKDWCQGELARDKNGNMVYLGSSDAVAYCMLGAMHRAVGRTSRPNDPRDPTGRAFEAMKKHPKINASPIGTTVKYGGNVVAVWNDDPSRTKDEVIEVFQELEQECAAKGD